MDYKIVFTMHPAEAGYRPINIECQAPEELCLMIRNTPIAKMSIAIYQAGGILVDKTPLLDFTTKGA